MEQWKLVSSTSQREYYVSDLGRMKSKDISSKRTAGEEKLLTLQRNSYSGYWSVRSRGINGTNLIHNIVAEAFIDKPVDDTVVSWLLVHKDKDKDNNSATNLQWLPVGKHGDSFTEIMRQYTAIEREYKLKGKYNK